MANANEREMANANEHERVQAIYYPKKLSSFVGEEHCMFCGIPTGLNFVAIYVHPRDIMGYHSCITCQDKMVEAKNKWCDTFGYGRIRYFKNAIIKIRRSSGEIEDGWKLGSPYVMMDTVSKKEIIQCTINCTGPIHHFEKWCFVDDIIDLNGAIPLAVGGSGGSAP